jgi:hypothetical protein
MLKRITTSRLRIKRFLPSDAYDRFFQKPVYEANTKYRFFHHFITSGHTTALLF